MTEQEHHACEARIRALAQNLADAITARGFRDETQKMAEEYHALRPSGELYELFYAEAALFYGNIDKALYYGEAAYKKRKMSVRTCNFLARAYRAAGRSDRALLFQILSRANLPEHLLEDDPELLERCLRALTIGYTPSRYAPLIREVYLNDGNMASRLCIKIGEELIRFSEDLPRYCIGVYNPYGMMHIGSSLVDVMNAATDKYQFLIYRDFIFDIMKAEAKNTVRIDTKGEAMLLPLAAKEEQQTLFFKGAKIDRSMVLGRGEFNFYRIDEPVTVRANQPFLVGAPISLGHNRRRKKLVLNILVDGLSWPAVRECFAARMPETAQFFARGAVFDQHFSTSEYTYPALPAIETGRCPHHTQVFNEQNSHPLLPAHRTLSECMKDLGYYCTAVMASGDGICSGALRGHDRILTHTGNLPCHEGIERTIRQLEAFDGADQFLFLHCADVHPWNGVGYKFATEVETHLPPEERLFPLEKNGLSVRLPHYPIYQQQFFANLRHVDRSLGQLFAYITQRYTEDEYIVNLYSDHGSSIFAPPPPDGRVDVISENSTGAAWMMCGAGVPESVRVQDLTSSVDIFPTLGVLCGFPVAHDIDGRLPAIFGGTARDVVYSSSQFPGQTFKLAVRSATHTLRVETQGFTQEDGTADFAGATARIYLRGHELEDDCAVDSAELRAFFVSRAREFVREIANNGEVFA